MTPCISRQRFHFSRFAFAIASSEAETVSPLSLTWGDVVSVFPTGAVTAGGLSGSPAFSIPWSPGNDPTDLPMSDEENPSFGNNPNAEDLT